MRLAVALVAVALVSGCGGSSSPSTDAKLETLADFVAAYGEDAEDIGVRITRAGRVASADGEGYVEGGAHVAIYVEPIGAATDAGSYIDRMVPLARLFVPSVFDRLPGITSIDVCQEPPGSAGTTTGEEAPPETVLLAYRDELGDVDWDALDTRGLVLLNRERPRRLNLTVSSRIAESAPWQALQQQLSVPTTS